MSLKRRANAINPSWTVILGKSCAIVLGLVTLPSLIQAEPVLEVYETYWPAEKVAPLVQDMLGGNDSIKVFKNKLIIRTERLNHVEIQRILEEVDRPPRNLLISVRQTNQHQTTSNGIETSLAVDHGEKDARSGDGDNNVVVYRGSSSDGRMEMRVLPRQAISTERDGSVHQVSVVEGEEAFIRLGEEIPVQQQILTVNGMATETRYKPVSRGFYVIPKLQRQQVFVEIRSHSQKPEGHAGQGRIDTSALNTTVSVPLGLWTPLGGVDQSIDQTHDGITYSTRQKGEQDLGYEIKVDIIP